MPPEAPVPKRTSVPRHRVCFAFTVVAGVVSTSWVLWAYPEYSTRTPGRQAAQVASAATVVAVAWVMHRRRPANPLWFLALVFITAGFLEDMGPPSRLLVTVAMLAEGLPTPAFLHLVLAYPSGRVTRRIDRWVIGAAYVAALGNGLVRALIGGDVHFGLVFRSYLYLGGARDTRSLESGLTDVLNNVLLVLALAGLGCLYASAFRARSLDRRTRLPVMLTATLSTIAYGLYVLWQNWDVRLVPGLDEFWIFLPLQTLVPVMLGVGIVLQRQTQAVVADLLVAMEGAPLESLEAILRRVLRDPVLELEIVSEVHTTVNPARSVPRAAAGMHVVAIEGAAGTVARLTTSMPADTYADLLPAVTAATRFAIENARMQGQLRAQVDELRDSRERITEAAAAERRRVERNLHDGAQQQLIGLGMQLDQIRRRLRRDPADADASSSVRDDRDGETIRQIESAITSLRHTVVELQLLARGVHPPILTARGLAPAVRSLVERMPTPIGLQLVGEERADPRIETAAYYVVAEGLSNALRHAQATTIDVEVTIDRSTLVVRVCDDGVGGADATSDGLRGLADRVAAANGTLVIDSPPERGTTVRAEFPCP